MKTRSIASGFVVGIASLLGVIAQGCSAETGAPEEGANVGTTAEALSTSDGAFLPGFINVDGTSKTIVIGGYLSNGSATNVAGLYDSASSGSWTRFRNSTGTADNLMPTGLGEVKIVKLDTNKYLVNGGRTTLDGSASDKSWILTLKVDGTNIERVSWTDVSDTNVTRVGHGFVSCGTNKFLAIGGATTADMENLAGGAETTSLRVATFGSGTVTWSDLLDSNNDAIALADAVAYAQIISFPGSGSNTEVRIAGGLSSGAPIKTTQKLTLDSNCKVTTDLSPNTAPHGNDMPAELAMAATAALPSAVTHSGTTYENILVGGINNGTNKPVTNVTYLYDQGADGYVSTGTIGTAAALAVIVPNGSNVEIMGGVVNNGATLLYNSTNASQVYQTNNDTWATAGTITTARLGLFAQDATHYGFGATYSLGATPTVLSDIVP